MTSPTSSLPTTRALAVAGALLAALAVALSAYAAHVADPAAQSRLQMAALFAFGHGIALAALAPAAARRLARIALAALLVGVLLFAGGLASAYFLGHQHASAAVRRQPDDPGLAAVRGRRGEALSDAAA